MVRITGYATPPSSFTYLVVLLVLQIALGGCHLEKASSLSFFLSKVILGTPVRLPRSLSDRNDGWRSYIYIIQYVDRNYPAF